ncbi:MAG: hypothetical protein CYG60_05610 [Actinobacteria bacterium]|nr:MAG: hypothetical protein CYG60_05610 [Actinomycetota bacterium]
MMEFKGPQGRQWYVTLVAVGGLMLMLLLAGVVGLLLNERVDRITRQAFLYDVELLDDSDDLLAAILEVRHYHRNIAFTGYSEDQAAGLDDAYLTLLGETEELEGLRVPEDSPQPEQIRAMAEKYHDNVRPALDLADTNPEAFEEVSDRELARLEEMRRAAEEIEEEGEERSESALESVERATSTTRLVLLVTIGGLLLVGAMLAYAAVHVVTEMRRSYARQKEAARAAERASRAKTDFVADVSHELRTPLTVLKGNAELGLALEEDCSHGEILEAIVEESENMTSMVEDLLFLTRSDSASLPLEMEPIGVEQFLAGVADRARVFLEQRGVTFRTEIRGDGEVNVDRRRAEQAIMVFVDNAAKFGSPEELVTLSSATERGELRVTVKNRGPTIPEESLPYVFERFYRVDKSRERKRGGTGLGLAIAKTIVQAHGGRVEARSGEREGTRMSLYLPLVAASLSSGGYEKSADGSTG